MFGFLEFCSMKVQRMKVGEEEVYGILSLRNIQVFSLSLSVSVLYDSHSLSHMILIYIFYLIFSPLGFESCFLL